MQPRWGQNVNRRLPLNFLICNLLVLLIFFPSSGLAQSSGFQFVIGVATAGGEITPRIQRIQSGMHAILEVLPADGYRIESVTGCNGTLVGSTYTTPPITQSCLVRARFIAAHIAVHMVTAQAGAGGSVSPSSVAVSHGASATFSVVPDTGYLISSVTGCNGSLSGNTYTTGPITQTCTVMAAFYEEDWGTPVGGILPGDTIWSVDRSPYILREDIQIPYGLTLQIEEGVRILGQGKRVRVFGELSIVGTPYNRVIVENTRIEPGNNSSSLTYFIDMSGVHMKGGEFLPPTGNSVYGRFNISYSVFEDMPYTYVWYPVDDCLIENNIFIRTGGFSIGHSDNVKVIIRNNVFADYYSPAVSNWASYGQSATIVEYNSFLTTNEQIALLLHVGYSNAAMDGRNNYWGTVDEQVIQSMIFDKNDDLGTAGYIPYSPFLYEPHANTPDPSPYWD